MEDFLGNLPGNSHTARIAKEQQAAGESENTEATETKAEKPAEKPKTPLTGKVTTRRKPLSVQFKEMFSSSDKQSFPDYLLNNVAVPMVQEMITVMVAQTLDGIKNGIQDRISGGKSHSTSTRTTSYGADRPRVNYNAQYSPSPRSVIRSTAPTHRPTVRRSNRVEDIFFDQRNDGYIVLEELEAKIDGFGHCTVADLYSYTDVPIKTTDESWGWNTLEGARVRWDTTVEKWQLVVPRPREIEFEN